MSSHDHAREALAQTPRWAVGHCVNGCVHVRLERLTLTLSAPALAELVQLLGEAYVRLAIGSAAAGIVRHQ
jgi:hypothetical protein